MIITIRQNIKRVPRIRGTTTEIDQRAKELRHNPTRAKALLWARLRNHQLNALKFRRLTPYPSLDDAWDHYSISIYHIVRRGEGRGEVRTQRFEEFGYRVIRFTNERVE